MHFESVYKSDYHENLWNRSNQILKTVWTTPLDMPEEAYRNEVVEQMNITEKYAPSRMLVDTKEAFYNVIPETQEWINERFVGLVEQVGLKKMAWIVSEDFFAQVSFDQVMDDANEQQAFMIQHFTNEVEALEWLLSK